MVDAEWKENPIVELAKGSSQRCAHFKTIIITGDGDGDDDEQKDNEVAQRK